MFDIQRGTGDAGIQYGLPSDMRVCVTPVRVLTATVMMMLNGFVRPQSADTAPADLPQWMQSVMAGMAVHDVYDTSSVRAGRFVGTATVHVKAVGKVHLHIFEYWTNGRHVMLRELTRNGLVRNVLLVDPEARLMVLEVFGGSARTVIMDLSFHDPPLYDAPPPLRPSGQRRIIADFNCAEHFGLSPINDKDTVRYWISDSRLTLFHDMAIWCDTLRAWPIRAFRLFAMDEERTALAFARGGHTADVVGIIPAEAPMPLLLPAPQPLTDERRRIHIGTSEPKSEPPSGPSEEAVPPH